VRGVNSAELVHADFRQQRPCAVFNPEARRVHRCYRSHRRTRTEEKVHSGLIPVVVISRQRREKPALAVRNAREPLRLKLSRFFLCSVLRDNRAPRNHIVNSRHKNILLSKVLTFNIGSRKKIFSLFLKSATLFIIVQC
jgi:hypothetical protein